jgi:hypothetical protein
MVRLTWVLAASLLVACGGSSNGDLTSGTGGSHADASAGSGGSAAGGSAGATTGGSGGLAAGAGGTSGGAGGATGGTGGATGGTGGATGGAGGATGGAGGATGGTGGMSGAGNVKCGLKLCAVSTQSCCFGDNVTPYCYKKDALAGCKCTGLLCEKAVVDCDGPEDCGTGQVCCATKGVTGSHFDRLFCSKTCQSGIGTTAAVVCHLNASGTCANGKACVADKRLPGGYGSCAP